MSRWLRSGHPVYAGPHFQVPGTTTMGERAEAAPSHPRRARFGLLGLLLAVSLAGAGEAAGQSQSFTPLQVALIPIAQVFPADWNVRGLRLNLVYGRQRDVAGFDVGFFNEVERNVWGIGIGIVNLSYGDASGLQLALTNSVEGRFRGLQTGLANVNDGNLGGIQLGALNSTGDGSGFQLGLFNRAVALKGIQLGLININDNGFLPFFPLINFAF